MTEDELYNWFFEKFESCYPIKTSQYPSDIFWLYDESYVRYLKLCKLNNQDILIPSKTSNVCLFQQDIHSEYLWCDDIIWDFFEKNYSTNYKEVNSIIDKFLRKNRITRKYKAQFNWLNGMNDSTSIKIPEKIKIPSSKIYNNISVNLILFQKFHRKYKKISRKKTIKMNNITNIW